MQHIIRFFQILKLEPKFLEILFFLYTVNEWNNLDNIMKSTEWYLMFRKRMLSLIRPKCIEAYGIHISTGLKLLTRLQLGLSRLNNHIFNNNFRDCINPLCSCSLSVENNVHFLLRCHHFSLQRQTLMNNIKSINKDIINEIDSDLVNILLFGSSKYEYPINSEILHFSIGFIFKTSPVNYFENSLMQIYELIFDYFCLKF